MVRKLLFVCIIEKYNKISAFQKLVNFHLFLPEIDVRELLL